MKDIVRRRRPEPEALDLNIVFEDDAIIALDKPPGMVVHPTYRNWSGTLLNGVLWHLRNRPGLTPHIVTRLDKDTSGLVLMALTPALHARVQKDAAAGRVKKEYVAIVRGTPDPPNGTIDLPLARSLEDRRRVVVSPTGQMSKTRYELLQSGGNNCSLVCCELITGRTHQIRVHMAARGWPILGDQVYGTSDGWPGRQALHAWRVALPHPVTREHLELESPLPAEFQNFRL